MALPVKEQLRQGLLFIALGLYPANQFFVPLTLSHTNSTYQTTSISQNKMQAEDGMDTLTLLARLTKEAHRNNNGSAVCVDFATYVYDEAISYGYQHGRTDILGDIRLVSGRVRETKGWTDHTWIDVRIGSEWTMFDPVFYFGERSPLETAIDTYPDRIPLAKSRAGSRNPAFYISFRHFDFINTGLMAHIINVSDEQSEALTNTITHYLGWEQ
jgi:hypothetical protein